LWWALDEFTTNSPSLGLGRKTNMNADELARNRFNALFAAHDAKDRPATVKQTKATEKAATKKPQ
jgi:hypothetical protein